MLYHVNLPSLMLSSLLSLSISNFAYLLWFCFVPSIKPPLKLPISSKHLFTSWFQYSATLVAVISDKILSLLSFIFSILLFLAFASLSFGFNFGFCKFSQFLLGLQPIFQLAVFASLIASPLSSIILICTNKPSNIGFQESVVVPLIQQQTIL